MHAQVRIDGTPNPNSLKFTVSVHVSTKAATFASPADAAADPLAKKLFEVPGVKSVFMISNFVTVTKDPATEWDKIAKKLAKIVEAHFE
ncbi:MAG TPA: NifU N-terminal domain-containing protein [Planctomycetota bacterium]|nr:NifU N-terminal domain-containing protein [Planctomycetota bacterium]